jgi:hypothetical protein
VLCLWCCCLGHCLHCVPWCDGIARVAAELAAAPATSCNRMGDAPTL